MRQSPSLSNQGAPQEPAAGRMAALMAYKPVQVCTNSPVEQGSFNYFQAALLTLSQLS